MSYSLVPKDHRTTLERRRVLAYLVAYPTRTPQLPTEVWERVLDKLDVSEWEDHNRRRRTFAACCLVCHAWLPRSRYHLFKFVEVQSKEQVKEVSKLLHSIPALRTRVEKLIVRGSGDAKKDAVRGVLYVNLQARVKSGKQSWVDRVGFHLGPKLKALEIIIIINVDFSLTKLEFYKFWGTFNKAWRPGVARELEAWDCTVNHLNQLIRLASVTKPTELRLYKLKPPEIQLKSTPPAPVLPSRISLPLRNFIVYFTSSRLVLSMEWHRFARQCPSLSQVEIRKSSISVAQMEIKLSSQNGRLCLVSIFDMFRRMQRLNDTNNIAFNPAGIKLELRTRPQGQLGDTDITTRSIRPRLCRELDLHHEGEDPMELSARALACFEASIVPGAGDVTEGFHRIEITYLDSYHPQRYDCWPLDIVLSRLRVVTPDAHVVVRPIYQSQVGCVLPWAREHFPMFTRLLPNAFCDPEAGRPCLSHQSHCWQVSIEQEQELEEEGEAELKSRAESEANSELGPQLEEEESGEREEQQGTAIEEKSTKRGRLRRTLEKVVPRAYGVARKIWGRDLDEAKQNLPGHSPCHDANPPSSSGARRKWFGRI